MKESIIVFSANVENWGAERSVCSMCIALQERGYHVLVVIPRKGPITNLLNEGNLDYIIHPFSGWTYEQKRAIRPDNYLRFLYKDIKTKKSITTLVKEKGYRPILVYSATILFSTGVYCAKTWGVPHVHHFRENVDAFGYKFMLGEHISMRYIRRNTNQIICTCNAVKNRYLKHFSHTPIEVINNGVPTIERFSLPKLEDKIRIVQVARFMNDKRIIDSLNAINQLVKQGITNFTFDIYGSGSEEKKYLDFIQEHNLEQYIRIVGFVQEIPFSKYNIGLMTSSFEAFARTTLDYMNNGIAVIASDFGGNTEQIIDKETGLLYHVFDYNDLADKIKMLLTKPELIVQFGESGRKYFIEHFTQERYREHISNVIIRNLKNERI